MPVSYIDPNAEARQAIVGLGQALIQRKFAKNLRAQEYMANPDRIAALAPAYRRAKEAGQEQTFLDSLGLPQEFGQAFDSFRPDVQEQTESAFVRAGGPEALGTAQATTAQVAGTQNRLLLDTGILDQRIQNEVEKLTLDSSYNAAATKLGLPELKAAAEQSGFQFDQTNNQYNSRLLNLRLENGIPELTVNTEALGLQLQQGAIEGYNDYIGGLPNTPLGRHLKNMAATAIANPSFANHVTVHEQLDAAAAARVGQASGDPADLLLNYTRWRTAMNDAIGRLNNEKLSDDERQAAMRDVNALRVYGESLMQAGAMLPTEITGARESRTFFGLRSKFETFGVKPELLDNLTVAASMVVNGQQSMESLQNSPSFKSLTPADQGRILAAIAAQQNKNAQYPGTAFEQASKTQEGLGGLVNGLPGMFPFNLFKLGYNATRAPFDPEAYNLSKQSLTILNNFKSSVTEVGGGGGGGGH